jgi:hypothetical protein
MAATPTAPITTPIAYGAVPLDELPARAGAASGALAACPASAPGCEFGPAVSTSFAVKSMVGGRRRDVLSASLIPSPSLS